MDKGLLFYILMLLWLVLGLYVSWPAQGAGASRFGIVGGQLLLFLLILILGWHNFGPPIK